MEQQQDGRRLLQPAPRSAPNRKLRRAAQRWFEANARLSEIAAEQDALGSGDLPAIQQLDAQECDAFADLCAAAEQLAECESATLDDALLKLLVWRESLAPDGENVSHLSDYERLGIGAVDELAAFIDSAQRRSA